MHIDKYFKTMGMHHDGSANNLRTIDILDTTSSQQQNHIQNIIKIGREFYQFVQPLKQRHDTKKLNHYFQVTKQFQIMGNLINNVNIMMHLQNQGPIFR